MLSSGRPTHIRFPISLVEFLELGFFSELGSNVLPRLFLELRRSAAARGEVVLFLELLAGI